MSLRAVMPLVESLRDDSRVLPSLLVELPQYAD
jgi:hypothetical protein